MAVTSKQARNGKAFEFALMTESVRVLEGRTSVVLDRGNSYSIAQECFNSFKSEEKESFLKSAEVAVTLIDKLEPRLSGSEKVHPTYIDVSVQTGLLISLTSDDAGKKGDVRDLNYHRPESGWGIGTSAKNNDDSSKHARFSQTVDFGQKWLGKPCASVYFQEILPVFTHLFKIRKESKGGTLWKEIGDYHAEVYFPVLSAFAKEMRRLVSTPELVKELVYYLVRRMDLNCNFSFPDSHISYDKNILAGYEMVGNVVPRRLAQCLVQEIQRALTSSMIQFPKETGDFKQPLLLNELAS